MTYLDNIISETSRFFCSGTSLFEREAMEDTTIGGVKVSKGVTVYPHWIACFYDPKYFDEPLKFIP
jgi:cytochrome P450